MNNRPQIKLTQGNHRQQPIVEIRFNYDFAIKEKLKKSTTARWSATLKCWYIFKEDFELGSFIKSLEDLAYIDYSGLNKKATEATQTEKPEKKNHSKIPVELPVGYLEILEQKRRSHNTIEIYTNYFKDFIRYFKDRDLSQITHNEINSYILSLIKEKGISPSQQNQRINAIKFYYEQVLGREKQYFDILRPAKERKLPDVLSKNEIKDMLKATANKKHKCVMALIYSCGLRRSEAIDLKIEDIDSKRMKIKIRGGKGKKDRYVDLPSSILPALRDYYREYTPKIWLFEGQKRNQYSPTSILNVVKKAAQLAGIKKRVYPHILRHSYATHFLEQGVDIRFIQEWMGHDSIKTTQGYTHVAQNNMNIKNPLDDII
ncbi:MAG: site-specific tyrosine recombinase/integron integrase [Bacteroidota bacterium]